MLLAGKSISFEIARIHVNLMVEARSLMARRVDVGVRE